MFLPLPFPEHLGRIKLVWVKFRTEAELAGDDLVEGIDNKFDVIAILVVPKDELMGLISFPA